MKYILTLTFYTATFYNFVLLSKRMIEYEIKPTGKLSLNLKELWQYKELFYFFTWRDIKIKYKQTFLGFTWAILQPFIMMIIFTILGTKLEIKSGPVSYPVFVYTGLMFWYIFANGLSGAGNSMINNANIIKKIYFPRLIIPVSSVLVSVFDFFMTLFVYIGLLIYYKTPIDGFKLMLYFPFSFIIAVVTTFGAGTLLAALNVKYRDFRYVIPFLIQILLFVTPVIYPASMFKGELAHFLISLNPMSACVTLARIPLSSENTDWQMVMNGCIVAFVLLITGIFYFRKTEAYFADIA